MKLEDDLHRISDLKTREERQKRLLENEQVKKQEMVKSLTKRERQLEKELGGEKKGSQKD